MTEPNELTYLTNIPESVSEYGFCKTLLVRKETIHLKHIFTEIFVRKTIPIEQYLNKLDISLFDYMELITNKLRKIHHISRDYYYSPNKIVKHIYFRFFPDIKLHTGLNNLIVLDFDGVCTKQSFHKLYHLCLQRCETVICSANPTITNDWFIKNNLPLPARIYAMKGKIKKIKNLLELNKRYDNLFYVDNEIEYLEYAWLFGIKTYHYADNKIKYFTMKIK